MKKIIWILFIIFSLCGFVYAGSGTATIQNVQVSGSNFSWDVYFNRADAWTTGGPQTDNAFGTSDASFNFNTSALNNPTVQVASGGPLDNSNYNVTVQILLNVVDVNIAFTNNVSAGSLPLSSNVKLFTVTMNITNSSLTSQLSWNGSNTGFFDSHDNNVNTTLQGSSDQLLPVELSSFTASVNVNNVNLSWKTATEVNNNGFEVERAVRSQKSEVSNWEKVGFVQGHGSSNSPKEYTYTDKNLTGGTKFIYRLKQIDNDGQYQYSKEIEVEVVPANYKLSQNYPNPFNPTTEIKYNLPEASRVILNVYNIIGQQVASLVNGTVEAGFHSVTFDGSNLPSGTYIYRLQTNNFVQTKKMILLK